MLPRNPSVKSYLNQISRRILMLPSSFAKVSDDGGFKLNSVPSDLELTHRPLMNNFMFNGITIFCEPQASRAITTRWTAISNPLVFTCNFWEL